jgi:hypothetical protein
MLRQGPPRSPANWPEFERALRALSVGSLAAAPPCTAHSVRRSNLPILRGSPEVGARRLKPQATFTKPLSGLGPGGGPPSEPPAPGLHQAGWRLPLSLPKPPLAHTLETAPKPARAARPNRAPCKLLDSDDIFTVQKLAPHPQPARFIALQPAVSKYQYPATLAELAGLSRNRLLALRLEVGKRIRPCPGGRLWCSGASPAAIGLRPAAPAASDAALRVRIPRAGGTVAARQPFPAGRAAVRARRASQMLRQGPPRSSANWPDFERALRALSVGSLAAAPPAHSASRPPV